ncbi:hypothetical protein BU24DRAFT_449952 [Aaosphaeria arxii CBS 175.79]|uniref:Uncharacterized protein n=1 Tax=Aaosphaeria arxii CBS 175.79 TaxID=1450172 RepID=A0A6A5Y138_9PLEO|nr:uncharacterized protein BU24DRAFT_449952 [Aaosphaeria arxii CBS 175.79]KAF2018520.1 hypothetical protein BU24DRAFT_449952 [Aaosphaeria arxii CBS 175.79]
MFQLRTKNNNISLRDDTQLVGTGPAPMRSGERWTLAHLVVVVNRHNGSGSIPHWKICDAKKETKDDKQHDVHGKERQGNEHDDQSLTNIEREGKKVICTYTDTHTHTHTEEENVGEKKSIRAERVGMRKGWGRGGGGRDCDCDRDHDQSTPKSLPCNL